MPDPGVRERKIYANALCTGVCRAYGAGMGLLWLLTDGPAYGIATLFALCLIYGFELEERKL